ncbi:hypothetical protein CEX98_10435 [Pseudoalteromonas piscicida]|uniref:Uncharacterized protein n=1 Tax=Pseudoalteromonas piscicida TaxID=43662 RepID=A0A2A5JQW5_PSEO7|nr:hypothetical protein CEX98_10435 [Pseudoalteromonas piscicida]
MEQLNSKIFVWLSTRLSCLKIAHFIKQIGIILRQKVNFNTLNYGIAGNYDNLPARLGLALQVK